MEKEVAPQFPWDVLAYILSFVPPSNLFSIILACRTFREIGQPLLYRHIDLSNCPARSVYLLRTLITSDDLCGQVRTFVAVDYDSRIDEYFNTRKWMFLRKGNTHRRGSACAQLAGEVAGKLINAENISMPTSHAQTVQTLAGLPGIKKFRTTSSLGFRGRLGSFFEAIPSATHLELPFNELFLYGSRVRPHHVPFLKELICPTNFAPFIVPGRPIRRLFLRWSVWRDAPDSFELMEAMARSTETIRQLGLFLGSRVNRQIDLDQIFSATATFLPDVEELTVRVECWKKSTVTLRRLLREVRWMTLCTPLLVNVTHLIAYNSYRPTIHSSQKTSYTFPDSVFSISTVQSDMAWRILTIVGTPSLPPTYVSSKSGHIVALLSKR